MLNLGRLHDFSLDDLDDVLEDAAFFASRGIEDVEGEGAEEVFGFDIDLTLVESLQLVDFIAVLVLAVCFELEHFLVGIKDFDGVVPLDGGVSDLAVLGGLEGVGVLVAEAHDGPGYLFGMHCVEFHFHLFEPEILASFNHAATK